ncbi:MAG TPA: glycine cleavage system protein H [Terriglobales bacterium]|nr:glycine cleavage system protein H [Terriglobales bacterium]
MSILFVLLMFLLIMSISYFRTRQDLPARAIASPRAPRIERENGFQIPQGYCFHPGHTWVSKEGPELARVGIDRFATNLIGKIDRIDVVGENRWVRQGQKLMTVVSGDTSVELLSPVEGVVTALNKDALQDLHMVARDPYEQGWIVMIKSPELTINQRNLVQGPMVAPWMQNSVTRLNGMVAQLAPTMAADGGLPIAGLLARVDPSVRQKIAKEFFL